MHFVLFLRVFVMTVFVMTVAVLAGQDAPTFEVASVKQNTSGERRSSVVPQAGGRITFTNIPARQLIVTAYQLTPFQLIGGPAWLDSDRFDIVAKLDPRALSSAKLGVNPQNLALQALLAERFKLKVHIEKRERDVYNLVMLKPGTPGPGLTASKADCAKGQCGVSTTGGVIRATGVPASSIAQMMTNFSGRVVYDRTNLLGGWDFSFRIPDEQRQDPDTPSLFTLVQEQFGMKLESAKAPVDVTVVDAIEHPTDD